MTRRTKAARKAAQHALDHADSYAAWQAAAQQLDQLSGADAWRADDDVPQLAADLLKQDMARLRAQREAGDLPALAETLHESIYRHQTDLTAEHLYGVALAGTKRLVDEYLDAVAAALDAFVTLPHPAITPADKRARLAAAAHNLGQPALLLSGGASMGFFHLGVVKALFDEGLLPRVICGASIGALMAGGVCARNDEEMAALFADIDTIYRHGIRVLRPADGWRRRGLLDQDQLLTCARENLGNPTFAEAAAHSGRTLCISVSPARARQKPRVLSAQTSPDVLVNSAILASAAVPGLYPAVGLRLRGADGAEAPYLPNERWVDGTFQGDLPTQRLARLFNVNHTIVSQVNPHVVPFLVSRDGRGLASTLADFTLSSLRAQTVQAMKVWQARIRDDRLHNRVEHARLLADQAYKGDTTIHPPISLWMYRRMLSNPTPADLRQYIRLGERATWPAVALIRNQTRIAREVGRALERLDAQA